MSFTKSPPLEPDRVDELVDELEDDDGEHAPGFGSALEKWDERRPTAAYMDFLDTLRSYDRMELEEDLVAPRVLDQLPTRLPDRERLETIDDAEGWVTAVCSDAGDGQPHDDPKAHPYLSGDRWDPHQRSWDAWTGRGSTILERFRGLDRAAGDEDLGVLKVELTLPPELHAPAWGEIVSEGGGEFAKLAHEFLEELWELLELPGEPVGPAVAIHRTSSSKPHEIRPHLHLLAPAVYRDRRGEAQVLEREPGSSAPLRVDHETFVDEVQPAMREAWGRILGEFFSSHDGSPENVHYDPWWLRDTRDRARLAHQARYISRPHLEDVNDRLLAVGPEWVKLDVEDRRDLESDVLHVPTTEFLEGVLTVQALTPDRWQLMRWFGDVSHRNWKALADELGVPDEDEPENLWGELVEKAREHDEADSDELLEWARDDLTDRVLEEIRRDASGQTDPELDPWREHRSSAAWRARACVEYVTLPLSELCSRCGAPLERIGQLDRHDVLELHELCQGDDPDLEQAGHPADDERAPEQIAPAVRRWRLIDEADLEQLKRDRMAYRMQDLELEKAEDPWDPDAPG